MNNLKGIFPASKVKNPCTPDCTERSITCHGKCEKYAEYAEAIKTENKNRRETKKDEMLTNKYEVTRSRKMKKKKESSKKK